MTGRDLLAEIEAGALDSSIEIADVLRKCVALGGQSGSAELRSWATQELKGYPDIEDLPDYRIIPAAIYIDGLNPRLHYSGQRISRQLLPEWAREHVQEEVRISEGIGGIAAAVRNSQSGSIRMGVPGAPELAAVMSRENWPDQITDVYYSLPVSSFEAIIEAVRTVLVELTAEIRAGLPAGEAELSQELADRALGIAVHGDHNRIIHVAGQAHSPITTSEVAGSPNAQVEVGTTAENGERRDWIWWLVALATIVGAGAAVWALFLR